MIRTARPPRPSPGTGPLVGEGTAVALLGGVAGVLVTVWAGAALASFATGADSLPFSLYEAGLAAARLPSRVANPASAWSPVLARDLPGPIVYWLCQALVMAVAGVAGWAVWWLLQRRPERDGLGVERSARFAKARDLRNLFVPAPQLGRIVLGRARGRLVAVESRTSVCIVGPSQSGKTSALCVPAILEMERGGGALIAASVKEDLMRVVEDRRAALGEVKVFDPTLAVVDRSATWSPLRGARTASGAQAAARALVDVAPSKGLENNDFWMSMAKELLWPCFFIAANTADTTMRDVVRWVTTHDRPQVNAQGRVVKEGEIAGRLRLLEAGVQDLFSLGEVRDGWTPVFRPEDFAEEVALAGDALAGIWAMDERTRSSVYTGARTVIEAWSDPTVARASGGCEITPEWLLSGDNTLFVVAPAREQARLRPVFAGLVADLVHAAFDAATRNQGALEHPLLVVLDEAANICPIRELPAWCSTCPGHDVTLVTVWQDRSQQQERYGREGAETIWNNSGAKVLLGGASDHALAGLVPMLGEEEHQRAGQSFDLAGGGRSMNVQTHTRRLVTEDALRRLPPGRALLVYKHLPLVNLALRPWHRDRTLRVLQAGGDAPEDANELTGQGEPETTRRDDDDPAA